MVSMGFAIDQMVKKLAKKGIKIDPDNVDDNREKRQEQESIRFTKQLHQNERKRMFKSSLVSDPDDLKTTFNDFNADSTQLQQELSRAKWIGANIRDGSKDNYLFSGKPGRGKTMLAVSILNALNSIPSCELSCLFVSVEMFMNLEWTVYKNNNSWDKDELYKEEQCIRNCDVLVLDDLGSEATFKSGKDVEQATKHKQEVLFRIADYRKSKTNIITTNNTGKELQTMYHPKIVSRLLTKDASHYIEFVGEDKRRS